VIRHNAVRQRLTVRLADGSEIETHADSLQEPSGKPEGAVIKSEIPSTKLETNP
jgi:hypothetical protein